MEKISAYILNVLSHIEINGKKESNLEVSVIENFQKLKSSFEKIELMLADVFHTNLNNGLFS